MTIAYFDCFSGAGGDMIVGALLDAGASLAGVEKHLSGLDVTGFQIQARRVEEHGFAATRFEVLTDRNTPQPHRHLQDILSILDRRTLPERVRRQAAAVFRRLAEAEARVHGTDIEAVHFHEVGAVDAIVDVVGAVAALHDLDVHRVVCSPIPTGSGTVKCEHGVIPIPAPATVELLKHVPLAASHEAGELTTPTAAALLTTLADDFGPRPPMVLRQTGYGGGARSGRVLPNVLRVLIGDPVGDANTDEVVVLEANLDDCTPEIVGHTIERLLAAGALDAYCVPIQMKKSRPGVLLAVLAGSATADALEDIMFAETTTFGVRRHPARRSKLDRRHESVATPFGPVRMKIGTRGDRIIRATPEFEDCRRAAEQHGVPLAEVLSAAQDAWRRHYSAGPNDV